MNKPEACRGCPAYGNGKGYVADEICEDATFLYVGGIPNDDAISAGRPFVGTIGDELNEKYFPRAGAERGRNPLVTWTNTSGEIERPVWETEGGNISLTYILRCKCTPTEEAIDHCRQYDWIQDSVRFILGSGELAWCTLSDNIGKVTEWRGGITKREPQDDNATRPRDA